MRLVLIAALATPLVLGALPAAAQDGAALYNAQCKSCHSVTGAAGAGPTLKGVVGRKIAGVPAYAYSAGLKAKTGTWADANLDEFLTNPSGFAPGSKMFVKVAKPDDRAALIAYLKTVK
jgi:cytochrome c